MKLKLTMIFIGMLLAETVTASRQQTTDFSSVAAKIGRATRCIGAPVNSMGSILYSCLSLTNILGLPP